MDNEYNGLSGEEIAPTEENPIEVSENEPVTDQPENDGEDRVTELEKKVGELSAELLKEQIKVRLLILGILPEKLDDGAAMAYGLCLAGKTPDEAAEEIVTAYPHLKAIRREIPQFGAESGGSGDGFSAIRRIFSAK